jgi:hypothetical protein
VNFPGDPRHEPYGGPGRPGGWDAQPGPIPLRPLGVGDLLGTAITVVRRCAMPLCLAAFVAAALSNGVSMGVLAAMGSLQSYAEAAWLEDIIRGGTSVPASVVASALASLVVSTVTAAVVAGLATAGAGALAQGRDGRGAVAQRMSGRWPVLSGVAVVVGVLCSAGLLLLVVPGVLAYLILVLAPPAAVMEHSGFGESLRRSAQLTRGHRGRILGVTVLAGLIAGVAGTVVTTLLSSVFGQQDPVTLLLISQSVGTLVAAFTGAWSGAVIALLYIDIRIRTEHLDYALRIAAASDRQRAQQQTRQPRDGLNPPPEPAG